MLVTIYNCVVNLCYRNAMIFTHPKYSDGGTGAVSDTTATTLIGVNTWDYNFTIPSIPGAKNGYYVKVRTLSFSVTLIIIFIVPGTLNMMIMCFR